MFIIGLVGEFVVNVVIINTSSPCVLSEVSNVNLISRLSPGAMSSMSGKTTSSASLSILCIFKSLCPWFFKVNVPFTAVPFDTGSNV